MESQKNPSYPPPPAASSSNAENPIVAVGRKVKSVLQGNQQRPSVRIVREPSYNGQPSYVPGYNGASSVQNYAPASQPHGTTYQSAQGEYDNSIQYDATDTNPQAYQVPTQANASTSRFGNWFGGRNKKVTGQQYAANEDCDAETVDLLDVMGMSKGNFYGRIELNFG